VDVWVVCPVMSSVQDRSDIDTGILVKTIRRSAEVLHRTQTTTVSIRPRSKARQMLKEFGRNNRRRPTTKKRRTDPVGDEVGLRSDYDLDMDQSTSSGSDIAAEIMNPGVVVFFPEEFESIRQESAKPITTVPEIAKIAAIPAGISKKTKAKKNKKNKREPEPEAEPMVKVEIDKDPAPPATTAAAASTQVVFSWNSDDDEAPAPTTGHRRKKKKAVAVAVAVAVATAPVTAMVVDQNQQQQQQQEPPTYDMVHTLKAKKREARDRLISIAPDWDSAVFGVGEAGPSSAAGGRGTESETAGTTAAGTAEDEAIVEIRSEPNFDPNPPADVHLMSVQDLEERGISAVDMDKDTPDLNVPHIPVMMPAPRIKVDRSQPTSKTYHDYVQRYEMNIGRSDQKTVFRNKFSELLKKKIIVALVREGGDEIFDPGNCGLTRDEVMVVKQAAEAGKPADLPTMVSRSALHYPIYQSLLQTAAYVRNASKSSLARPKIPIVTKAYEDDKLVEPNVESGERECMWGYQCEAFSMLKEAYPDHPENWFVPVEFTLVEEDMKHQLTGHRSRNVKMCLVCNRYHTLLWYSCLSADAKCALNIQTHQVIINRPGEYREEAVIYQHGDMKGITDPFVRHEHNHYRIGPQRGGRRTIEQVGVEYRGPEAAAYASGQGF
jgi:hypothetical protein